MVNDEFDNINPYEYNASLNSNESSNNSGNTSSKVNNTTNNNTTSEIQSSDNNSSAIVYWTPNGKSYHTTKSCSTLSRSKTINSGTQSQSGKNDPCDRCH